MTGYDDLIEQLRRESGVDVMGNWLNETLREAADAIETLQAERSALRQALWDVRGILGFDQDGCDSPDAMVHPPLGEAVKRDAAIAAADYDEAIEENAALRARASALETALRDTTAERDAARALAGRLFVGDRPDDTVAGLERWLLAIPRAEARELDAEVEIFCDVSEDARRALRPTSPGDPQ